MLHVVDETLLPEISGGTGCEIDEETATTTCQLGDNSASYSDDGFSICIGHTTVAYDNDTGLSASYEFSSGDDDLDDSWGMMMIRGMILIGVNH